MLKNYLKIAWRSLLRQKLYSLINIGGLAMGLCVCMLVMLYVAHEYSYDSFHNNAGNIFALDAHRDINGNKVQFANTSFGTATLTAQGNGKVSGFMRIHKFDDGVIVSTPSAVGSKFAEKDILAVDQNFFSFFNFKLLNGNAGQVLSKPNALVISADIAKKYFGDSDPVGKTLSFGLDSLYQFEVTGVVQNAPSNTIIKYNFIVPNAALKNIKEMRMMLDEANVGSGYFKTYLQLRSQNDTAAVKRTLQTLLKQHPESAKDEIMLTALPDMHVKDGYGDQANVKYLKIFPLVAALVLLLALVNYMSLATARASVRAKEVGVRKVNGAARSAIAWQFYIESAMYAAISFVLAYLLCYLMAGTFMAMVDLKIDISFLYSIKVILIMAALLLLTIVVAGSYPAVVLSSFKPVITLKGSGQGNKGITVRKVFTTLQFATSIALIICGIVINSQLYFFRHKDTGINRENVLVMPFKKDLGMHYQSFKKDVLSVAGVSGVATAKVPLYKYMDAIFANNNNQSTVLFSLVVDPAFVKQLGIKWKTPPADEKNIATPDKIILNETAVTKLGLQGNPVGQIVDADHKYQIAGVIRDVNINTLQRTVDPMCLIVIADENLKYAYVEGFSYIKIKPNVNMPTVLTNIKQIYQRYDKEVPFDYNFLDDSYNKQYKAEERLSYLFDYFMVITIILAALGLFGLAAFTIEQRTKEIGIRKVLGAGLVSINSLLSVDFLKLVLLAIIIASPVAWWAMHNWLQGFAYRIAIPWWAFFGAGGLAIVVALSAISYHSIKAALADPVKSLRNE